MAAIKVSGDGTPNPSGTRALIKSKERVKNHGEVFTPEWVVEMMLDMVQDEVSQIWATVLEPSCGDGNFLVGVLKRKLARVAQTVNLNHRITASLCALSSIYAIDLLPDNVATAQQRVFDMLVQFLESGGITLDQSAQALARFIIETNIVQADTLTGLNADGKPVPWLAAPPACATLF